MVYKLDPAGKYKVLHAFASTPNDGGSPYAELIMDKSGSLYGTTNGGGTTGEGTVFKVSRTGKEMVLHCFGGSDGAAPYAGLLRDTKGNLYSTTNRGGTFDSGVVFRLSTSGVETVLYSFNYSDGHFPTSGVTRDRFGNLFGTTNQGGAYGYGAVFKLNPRSGKETVLHSFTGGGRRRVPSGRVDSRRERKFLWHRVRRRRGRRKRCGVQTESSRRNRPLQLQWRQRWDSSRLWISRARRFGKPLRSNDYRWRSVVWRLVWLRNCV